MVTKAPSPALALLFLQMVNSWQVEVGVISWCSGKYWNKSRWRWCKNLEFEDMETNYHCSAACKLSKVSCVCWVTCRNETMDTLCYSNGAGFLVFLQHHESEVSTWSYPCSRSPQCTNSLTQSHFKAHFAHLAQGEEIISIMADISDEKTVRIATRTWDRCI